MEEGSIALRNGLVHPGPRPGPGCDLLRPLRFRCRVRKCLFDHGYCILAREDDDSVLVTDDQVPDATTTFAAAIG
jgi:hypothetical protein